MSKETDELVYSTETTMPQTKLTKPLTEGMGALYNVLLTLREDLAAITQRVTIDLKAISETSKSIEFYKLPQHRVRADLAIDLIDDCSGSLLDTLKDIDCALDSLADCRELFQKMLDDTASDQ